MSYNYTENFYRKHKNECTVKVVNDGSIQSQTGNSSCCLLIELSTECVNMHALE